MNTLSYRNMMNNLPALRKETSEQYGNPSYINTIEYNIGLSQKILSDQKEKHQLINNKLKSTTRKIARIASLIHFYHMCAGLQIPSFFNYGAPMLMDLLSQKRLIPKLDTLYTDSTIEVLNKNGHKLFTINPKKVDKLVDFILDKTKTMKVFKDYDNQIMLLHANDTTEPKIVSFYDLEIAFGNMFSKEDKLSKKEDKECESLLHEMDVNTIIINQAKSNIKLFTELQKEFSKTNLTPSQQDKYYALAWEIKVQKLFKELPIRVRFYDGKFAFRG